MDPDKMLDIGVFLDENATCLLKQSEFEELHPSVVLQIVRRSTMDINESFLFECLLVWARAECCRQHLPLTPSNMRAVLGDILYSVRLLTIWPLELIQRTLASGVFTVEEQHMFRLALADNMMPIPSPWLPSVLRSKRHDDRQARWHYVDIDHPENAVYRRESCALFSLKDLVVLELIFNLKSDGGQVDVLCEIMDTEKKVKAKCAVKANNQPEQTAGSFRCPIFFKANSFYTLTFTCFHGYVERRGAGRPQAMFKGENIFFLYTLKQGSDERKVSFNELQVRQLSGMPGISLLLHNTPHMHCFFETNLRSVISSVAVELCL